MFDFFKNKTPNFNKLLSYGFCKNKNCYEFSKDILSDEFTVLIKIFNDGKIKTETIEKASGDIYTLHLIENAKGSFIGQVKTEYENLLKDVMDKCFDTEIFKSKFTKQIIEHITKKYNDTPEYLWEKFPENAIFRRKDNQKWYAAILTVPRDRLGFGSDEIAEVINLKAQKEDVPNLIKQKNIYPAWHMNKKSWITIILDGSMKASEIYKFIDKSYVLVKKAKFPYFSNFHLF